MADAKNRRARLTSAYHELGRQLTSGNLTVVGNYTLQRTIGEGSYGTVRLATHRLTNSRVAVKQIPKEHVASLTREIHHHRRLHHPNVLQLYEVIQSESYIWMVTELCVGGELYDYVVQRGSLEENEARKLFGQLCLAVAYIHSNGIVHRDLKLENILLDAQNQIKLSDFGFTREFEPHQFLRTKCGTTAYAAPEMLAGLRYQGSEVDIWSLGVILFVLLCGYLPFDDDNEPTMQWKIVNEPVLIPNNLSQEAQSLLSWILQKDASKRPSIRQILSHPWYQQTSPSLVQESSLGIMKQTFSLRPLSPCDTDLFSLPPTDFVAMLTEPAYAPFQSPIEQQLLHTLQTLGFAVGQIHYSVQTNACDAAGALWWLLLHKAQNSQTRTSALGISYDDPGSVSSPSETSGVSSRRASLSRGGVDGIPLSQTRSSSLASLAPVATSNKISSSNPESLKASPPQTHVTDWAISGDEIACRKKPYSPASIKSWLVKNGRESETDTSQYSLDAATTAPKGPGEPSNSCLAPPLLPAQLISSTTRVSLAPSAATSVTSSPSQQETSQREKMAPLEPTPKTPSRPSEPQLLRRTSSMARPGNAYGQRLSVTGTSKPMPRERSQSLSSPHSPALGAYSLRSRQSSWNSSRFARPRRGSESTTQRQHVSHFPSARTPEFGALSRKTSGISDSSDISRRGRPVSMDEQAMAAFWRRHSFSNDGESRSVTHAPRSPRLPMHSPKVISPRVRASLPRNRARESKGNASQSTVRKKKALTPNTEDDWIDETCYVGGIGQPSELAANALDWLGPGMYRQRGGSPCPPRMMRSPRPLTPDTRPNEASLPIRGKMKRREPHTPVIEEEEP